MKNNTKSRIIFLFAGSILFLSGLLFLHAHSPGKKDLVILFTNDMHSYFLPHKELDGSHHEITLGGFAKLSTIINSIRKANPDKTLLLDAGDFSMGSLFHTLYMTRATELQIMSLLGYDVTTLGNHEFDFYPEGLAKMLRAAKGRAAHLPKIVSSNTVFSVNDPLDSELKKAYKEYPVAEYTVIEKNGLKIGIFGLFGKDAYDSTPFARPVSFSDVVEAGKKMVEVLKNREKVDIVICLSHSGTSANRKKSEDEYVAKKVPGIDVIISGHTHSIIRTPLIVGKTIIVSAGKYSSFLGELHVSQNKKDGVKSVFYELKSIRREIPDDPAVSKMIQEFKDLVNDEYLKKFGFTFDQVIAKSAYTMESQEELYENHKEAGLGNLITDSYRYAVEKLEGDGYQYVNIVVQPYGHIRNTFFAGDITVSDVFSVLSLGRGIDQRAGYPLISCYVKGSEVKDLLEVHTTIGRMKEDAQLQFSGIHFSFNPFRAPFDRVTGIKISDRDGTYRNVDPSKLYRIVVNYYTLKMIDYVGSASHGILNPIPREKDGSPVKDLASTIIKKKGNNTGESEIKEWEALAFYLQSFRGRDLNQVPLLPEKYSKTDQRITEQPSWNPFKLVQNGNVITWTIFTILIIILSLTFLIIRCLIKIIVRRRN